MFASYQLPPKSDNARAFPAKQAEFEVRIEDDSSGSYRPHNDNNWQQVSPERLLKLRRIHVN